MYRKILVPLDGSRLAEEMLPYVKTLARCTGAELVLLRVPIYAYAETNQPLGAYRRVPSGLTDERDVALREVTEYLKHIQTRLALEGLKVATIIAEGDPAQTIIRTAQTEQVDLIAMSTHGYTGLPRVIFGSVAETVLRGAGIPVLLFRPELKS